MRPSFSCWRVTLPAIGSPSVGPFSRRRFPPALHPLLAASRVRASLAICSGLQCPGPFSGDTLSRARNFYSGSAIGQGRCSPRCLQRSPSLSHLAPCALDFLRIGFPSYAGRSRMQWSRSSGIQVRRLLLTVPPLLLLGFLPASLVGSRVEERSGLGSTVARHPEVAFSPRETSRARVSGSGTRGETAEVAGVGWAAYSSLPHLVSGYFLLPRAVLAILNRCSNRRADFGFVSMGSGTNATELCICGSASSGRKKSRSLTPWSGNSPLYLC